MSNPIVYLIGIILGFIDCAAGAMIFGEVLESPSMQSGASDIWDIILMTGAILLGALGLHLWLYGLSPPSSRR